MTKIAKITFIHTVTASQIVADDAPVGSFSDAELKEIAEGIREEVSGSLKAGQTSTVEVVSAEIVEV